MRVVNYDVVARASEGELVAAMRVHLLEGWQPLGGISAATCYATWENSRKGYDESEQRFVFAQAMVKYEEVPVIGARAPDAAQF